MSLEQPGTPGDQHDQDHQRWRTFGQEVERLRLERGYTATQLAKHAGVSYQSVVTLEQGGFRQREGGPWMLPNPQDRILASIASTLGVNVEDWFGLVGRYDQRPRTRRSLRRASGKTAAADELDELRERVLAVEQELQDLRAERGEQEPGKGRRRRAPG